MFTSLLFIPFIFLIKECWHLSLTILKIAISNTELSVKNFKAAMSVPATLGLDPTIANAGQIKFFVLKISLTPSFSTYLNLLWCAHLTVHQMINSGPGSILPSSFQKAMLEGIFSLGRMQLSEFILNENNPLGSSRLGRVRSIFDEGKSLQLQFPAEDLGFRSVWSMLYTCIFNYKFLNFHTSIFC